MTNFGNEIHSDVWGSLLAQTPGYKEYYVSFTDNYTQWTHLWLLASKNEVLHAYQDFEAWATLHFDILAFKHLWSDRGGEYLGDAFSSHLASKGTVRKLTIHDTPEYNGVSEHLNQTFLEWTHALLHQSELPKDLWGKAITHVVWLKNRMLTRTLPDGKMPYKMLYRKKPSLQKLQNWGTKVWVHTMDGLKLDGHLRVGRWIGLDEVSNGYWIYWLDR